MRTNLPEDSRSTKSCRTSRKPKRQNTLTAFALFSLLTMNMILVDFIDGTSIATHAGRQKQFAQRRPSKKPRMHSVYNSDVESVQLLKPPAAVANSNYRHYYRQSAHDRWKKTVKSAGTVDFDSANSTGPSSNDEIDAPAGSEATNEDKLEISIRVNGHPAPDVSVYKLPSTWLLNSQQSPPTSQASPAPPLPPPPPPPPSPPAASGNTPSPSLVTTTATTTTAPDVASPPPPLGLSAAAVTVITTEEPEVADSTPDPSFLGGAKSSPDLPQLPSAASPEAFAQQQAQIVQQQQQQQQALQQQAQQIQVVQQQLAQLQQQVSPGTIPPVATTTTLTSAPLLTAASSSSTSSTQYNVLLASPNAADDELRRLIEEPDECSGPPTQFSDSLDDSRFFSPDSVQTEESPADAKWASEKAFLFQLPESTKLKDEDPSHYFQILFPQPYKLYGWRVRGFAGAVDGDDGGLAAYQAQVFDSSSKRWVHILDDAGEARIFSAMPTFKTNGAGELANEIYPVELSVPITDVAGLRVYPMQWIHKPYFKISVNGCPLTVVSSSAGGSSTRAAAAAATSPVAVTTGPNKSKRMAARKPPSRARAAAFELDEDQQQLSQRENDEELGLGEEEDDIPQRNHARFDSFSAQFSPFRQKPPQVEDTPPPMIESAEPPPEPRLRRAEIEPPKIELHFPHRHRRRRPPSAEAHRKRHFSLNDRFDRHDDTAPAALPSQAMTVNSNNNVLPAQITCQARILQMSDGLDFYRIDHGQQVRNLHSTPDLSSSSKRGWIVMRLLATPPSAALQDADENKLFGLEVRFTKGAYVEKLIIASAVREPDLTSIVTAFTVQYLKLHDDEWQWVRDPAATQNVRVFELPVDNETSPQQLLQANYTLDFSFRAKLGALRIFPQRWYRFPGFRVGLLGCVDA